MRTAKNILTYGILPIMVIVLIAKNSEWWVITFLLAVITAQIAADTLLKEPS